MGPETVRPCSPRPTHHDTDAGPLVRAAARGDEPPWNALVDRYSGLVWAIARNHRLSAADADEVFQTTWLRLVEHVDRLQDPAKVGGWLATTARHESLRLLRRAGRQIPMGDDLPEPDSPARPRPTRRCCAPSATAAAGRRSPACPSATRRLLRLLTADPAPSYEEIGAALNMPAGSIGPTRARCLERLRREARPARCSQADDSPLLTGGRARPALAAGAANLDSCRDMEPTASIIVPTRLRAGYLDVALASIAPQAAAAGAELLVVDDGPDEATRAAAASATARATSPTSARAG